MDINFKINYPDEVNTNRFIDNIYTNINHYFPKEDKETKYKVRIIKIIINISILILLIYLYSIICYFIQFYTGSSDINAIQFISYIIGIFSIIILYKNIIK